MSAPTLLIVPQVALPAVTVSQVAIESKDRVLGASALIASVKTADDNRKCFEARRAIEGLSRELEKERKKVTDPINDWLRQFKATVDTQRQELEQESGRLAQLEKDFNLAEQRRVFEEQEAQRRELERIERERQAELQRIRDEKIAAEFKAKMAAKEAERLAMEATNKKQREAAEKARLEAEAQAAEAASVALAQTQRVEEVAAQQAYIEAAPVEQVRAKGQTVREVWVIDQINDFQLLKARPDLVRSIEWDKLGINAALESGQTLPGVKAHKDTRMGGRGKIQPVINV